MIQELRALISKSQKVLVIAHMQPDADAYGSSLAAAEMFRIFGKEVVVLNQDGILKDFRFVPGVEVVTQAIPEDFNYDLICVCDCGDQKRIGDELQYLFDGSVEVVNIDHHNSNTMFGDLNIVDVTLSSSCELVANLIEKLQIVPDPQHATQLLLGIVGDTGSFRYRNTTSTTLKLAAQLVEQGANLTYISENLFGTKSLESIKLESEVLRNIQVSCSGKLSKVVVTQDLLKQFGASKADCEGIVERARDIENVQVALFMFEDLGFWKMSLRSIKDELNVSEIAQKFGGGGHKQAAGFRCKLPREDFEPKLMGFLEELLANG